MKKLILFALMLSVMALPSISQADTAELHSNSAVSFYGEYTSPNGDGAYNPGKDSNKATPNQVTSNQSYDQLPRTGDEGFPVTLGIFFIGLSFTIMLLGRTKYEKRI